MSEYIRTNKFDTNECPNIFGKEKLIRTNVRIYIRDQYIRIFEYSNIFVTLWTVSYLWESQKWKSVASRLACLLRIPEPSSYIWVYWSILNIFENTFENTFENIEYIWEYIDFLSKNRESQEDVRLSLVNSGGIRWLQPSSSFIVTLWWSETDQSTLPGWKWIKLNENGWDISDGLFQLLPGPPLTRATSRWKISSCHFHSGAFSIWNLSLIKNPDTAGKV